MRSPRYGASPSGPLPLASAAFCLLPCAVLVAAAVNQLEQDVLRARIRRRDLERGERLTLGLGLIARLQQPLGEIGVRRRAVDWPGGECHSDHADSVCTLAARERHPY